MYPAILVLHSFLRWLVLISILASLITSLSGWKQQKVYSKRDDTLRSVAVLLAHIQLMLGFVLYFKSPIIAFFRTNFSEAITNIGITFFGLYHISMMTVAVTLLTIGSAKGKRAEMDTEKFRTVALFFLLALILILLAIPWPFMPFAGRPLFRTF